MSHLGTFLFSFRYKMAYNIVKGGFFMNKVFEYIVDEVGYDEPVFTKQLKTFFKNKISDETLRQNLKRLSDKGYLMKVENGVYYVPRSKSVLKQPKVNIDKVIMRKYIKPNDNKIIGYTCGINFANQLGITTQTASVYNISTNASGRKINEVKIGKKTVKLRKPKVEITNRNYKVLQVLDLLNEYEKVSEIPLDNASAYLYIYLQDVEMTQQEFNQYLYNYSKKTICRALDMGLNNAITQG